MYAIKTRVAWVMGFLIASICANASATSQKGVATQNISAEDMAAFSRVIAEEPLGKPFPYNVRAVVYSNPNNCLESAKCANSNLFLVVIGDGEIPDYKVYDVGNAINWEFVRWVHIPSQFFDNERDWFVIELIKTVPCNAADCDGETTRKEMVKAQVSLFDFRWVE